jgi:ABC-type transporter Mla MlaB component
MPPAERPPGSVTTFVSDEELLVLLSGEIDLCLRLELEALTRTVVGYDGRVVVDVADVTFCDGTLAAFLAETLGHEPVAVRAPRRLVRDLISLYGVDRDLRIVG